MLSQIRIAPTADFPAGTTGEALNRFREGLIDELVRAEFPKE